MGNFLGFGLLVEQNKQIEDVTVDHGKNPFFHLKNIFIDSTIKRFMQGRAGHAWQDIFIFRLSKSASLPTVSTGTTTIPFIPKTANG